MNFATVKISHCIQDMQKLSVESVPDSVMRSRIFFSMVVGGREHPDLYVDISQPYGTDYAVEPVEVGPPVGYRGPFNDEMFSECVEQYYHRLVACSAQGERTEGCSNVRVRDTTTEMPHVFGIEISYL